MAIEMKILKDHSDWLENRKNGIGGSEISAVVGLNPYMSNIDLWERKTGRKEAEDISEKSYVKYGTQAEPHLRELFKLDFPQYKVDYVENNSFVNDKYPWAKASLDGWLEERITIDDSTEVVVRKGILEIKTTEILNSTSREKWKNQIPQNYYCQVLFYMAVLEADFAILKAQLKTVIDGVPYLQIKHYKIEKEDVQADMEYLMQKGSEYWNNYILADRQPPLLLPDV